MDESKGAMLIVMEHMEGYESLMGVFTAYDRKEVSIDS